MSKAESMQMCNHQEVESRGCIVCRLCGLVLESRPIVGETQQYESDRGNYMSNEVLVGVNTSTRVYNNDLLKLPAKQAALFRRLRSYVRCDGNYWNIGIHLKAIKNLASLLDISRTVSDEIIQLYVDVVRDHYVQVKNIRRQDLIGALAIIVLDNFEIGYSVRKIVRWARHPNSSTPRYSGIRRAIEVLENCGYHRNPNFAVPGDISKIRHLVPDRYVKMAQKIHHDFIKCTDVRPSSLLPAIATFFKKYHGKTQPELAAEFAVAPFTLRAVRARIKKYLKEKMVPGKKSGAWKKERYR